MKISLILISDSKNYWGFWSI